jgi:hypothetical protein
MMLAHPRRVQLDRRVEMPAMKRFAPRALFS